MNNYTIEQVLPHKNPMILIDKLIAYDINSACCQVNITANSPFYEASKQGVPSYIGSEYMAQTIAAFAGAHALDKQQDVKIGFLLGSRKYQTFTAYFTENTTINININELYKEDSGLSVFECEILSQENTLLAKANINVFQPQDAHAFITENQ